MRAVTTRYDVELCWSDSMAGGFEVAPGGGSTLLRDPLLRRQAGEDGVAFAADEEEDGCVRDVLRGMWKRKNLVALVSFFSSKHKRGTRTLRLLLVAAAVLCVCRQWFSHVKQLPPPGQDTATRHNTSDCFECLQCSLTHDDGGATTPRRVLLPTNTTADIRLVSSRRGHPR